MVGVASSWGSLRTVVVVVVFAPAVDATSPAARPNTGLTVRSISISLVGVVSCAGGDEFAEGSDAVSIVAISSCFLSSRFWSSKSKMYERMS